MNNGDQNSALSGVKVLDLSRFIAGPLCAQFLADFGATVLKVERPGGEDARKHAPFIQGESIYTMLYNRNKHAVTLNTRAPEAQQILTDLITWADVVIENYRPGTMSAMGLDYERIQQINPGCVLVSISGFGQTGPLANRALFDAIAQAQSGLMDITGDADGPPTLTGAYLADYIAGYHGAIGALGALYDKATTGRGQHIDISSVDAVFTSLGTLPTEYKTLGKSTHRSGSRDKHSAPANVYQAGDRHIYIHGGTDPLFPRLCAAMGKPELAQDPRFATVRTRMQHADVLEDEIQRWIDNNSLESVENQLTSHGIPYGLVNTVADITDSQQIEAREMMINVQHAVAGTVPLPGFPIKLSRSTMKLRKAPPAVGEDNETVYQEILGFTDSQIQDLRKRSVI